MMPHICTINGGRGYMAQGKITRQQANQDGDRRHGLRHASAVADRLTQKVYGRRGFAMGELLTRWPLIAGESLARHTFPEQLRFPHGKGDEGTLWIRAEGAIGLELQHLQPVLIERINVLCGFRAVRDIRIVQGPIAQPQAKAPVRRRQLEEAEISQIRAEVVSISDPLLSSALMRLGAGILRTQKAGAKKAG